MVMFQGDNETLTLVLKDDNGENIESNIIDDMVAVLYLEYNNKPYVYWCLDGGSIYDRNKYPSLTSKTMNKSDDRYSIVFNLDSADTESMTVGRYIIQVSYNIASEDLSEGKFVTEYGVLTSIQKLN